MTCLLTLFRRCARTARAFLTASVRSHRIALGGAAIGLALVSCASVPELMPPRPLRIEIQSGKIAEECFALAAEERIDYQFEASAGVDFNLHTHRGGQIVTPVDVKRTRAQAGIFASPRAEEYCMMWTNVSAVPAHVTGQWRRLRR
jgi:hypothetical protein